MTNRTHSTTSAKPAKPSPDFPLFAADNGQWGKKIRGKKVYFGVWANSEAALQLYYREKSDWEAGRNPRQVPSADFQITIGQMVAYTLDAKEDLVKSGELSELTYHEYTQVGERLKRVWGSSMPVARLGPAEFSKLKRDFMEGRGVVRDAKGRKRRSAGHKSLVSLKGDVRKVRVFFHTIGPKPRGAGYLKELPAYGVFQVPSAKSLRMERARKPKRMFLAEQIRAMLEVANPTMRAMILLGINCAFGNTDCALFTLDKLDLRRGWHSFPRPKTAVRRLGALWPETLSALKAVLADRQKPATLVDRVFITTHGNAWGPTSVCDEFKKVRRRAGLTGVPNFGALRHTFATIAKRLSRDVDAIRMVTGHVALAFTREEESAENVLDVHYDQDLRDVSPRRVQLITDAVRTWLMTARAESSEMELRDVLSFEADRLSK